MISNTYMPEKNGKRRACIHGDTVRRGQTVTVLAENGYPHFETVTAVVEVVEDDQGGYSICELRSSARAVGGTSKWRRGGGTRDFR